LHTGLLKHDLLFVGYPLAGWYMCNITLLETSWWSSGNCQGWSQWNLWNEVRQTPMKSLWMVCQFGPSSWSAIFSGLIYSWI